MKKGNGEIGRQSMDAAEPVDVPATQTDSDVKSAGMTVPGMSSTASDDDSGSSSQDSPRQPESGETVADEPPRKRRGILLGTRPGQATPAAVDDGKSLSWMASQAVKATNAVKASQLEQAQAWKAGAGMSEDGQSDLAEDHSAVTDGVDSLAMEQQEPAQRLPGEVPAATEAVAPVESSQEASTPPHIPPGARARVPGVPARMALMLGVLLMFSYAGYRHWFSGDRTAGNVPDTTSAIIEPDGAAAEEVRLMTPPAISVVAAPESAAEHPVPPAAGADTAPMPGPEPGTRPATAVASDEPGRPAAEEVELMTPPATRVVSAPEPAAEHPAPPAAEAGRAPMPGPALGTQPAMAGSVPQPMPSSPASAAPPKSWYPSAVPAAPSPSAEADTGAGQSAPSSSPPPAEVETAASQPAPPASPVPAVEAGAPARQGYPANGYGYYQPPSSWQPYYQPGYQQAPARR